MRDQNAAKLLAKVMGWEDLETVPQVLPTLQLLADFKYDHYQRFGPGRRFIESLALWLHQFEPQDRETALRLVLDHLVFISDDEFSHLVRTAYRDWIVQERMRLVSEEHEIPSFRVQEIARHRRFEQLRLTSLYLGLSDGARTNELRRASDGEIGNEQIWQAYELGDEKAEDMLKDLKASLLSGGFASEDPRFNLIWLLDDFSGSGNTYIRYNGAERRFQGKLPKIYQRLHQRGMVDPSHYEVFLMGRSGSRQAMAISHSRCASCARSSPKSRSRSIAVPKCRPCWPTRPTATTAWSISTFSSVEPTTPAWALPAAHCRWCWATTRRTTRYSCYGDRSS